MAKWIRNEYYKKLTYENLFKAHLLARKGKNLREEIIKFNLKQEEYIMYLYEQLKNKTYKHGGYTVFYITEPKLRKIERSRYLDRIVHTFYVENFLKPYFLPQFIPTSYACKEAYKYLTGHLGYIKIANVKNLTDKLFYKDLE